MTTLVTTRHQYRKSLSDSFFENTAEQLLYYKTEYMDTGLLISDTSSISEDGLVMSRTWVWDTGLISSETLSVLLHNDGTLSQYNTETDVHCAQHNITRSNIEWSIVEDGISIDSGEFSPAFM
jgi:hypothetical protein